MYHIDKIYPLLHQPDLVKDIFNSINVNQRASKHWLVDKLVNYISMNHNKKILIAAGWYGYLGHLLNDYEVTKFDIDPKCHEIGYWLYPELNHVICDINDFNPSGYGTVICTSCEHISDIDINNFIKRCDDNTIVCLQSNDYFGVDGHINCKNSIRDFIDSVNINIIERFELKRQNYTRFMVIGNANIYNWT